jgi:hypothetical protein
MEWTISMPSENAQRRDQNRVAHGQNFSGTPPHAFNLAKIFPLFGIRLKRDPEGGLSRKESDTKMDIPVRSIVGCTLLFQTQPLIRMAIEKILAMA